MKATLTKTVSAILTIALLAGLSGCGEEHRSDSGKPLRLHPIYGSAIFGAIVGGIIGHQSDETGEGAAVGAVICGVGALLSEIDRANKEDEDDDDDGQEEEEVVFQIHNDNGPETPVVLKKKGSTYIGPNGERYDRLPAEEQLRPIYGS